MSSTRSRRSRPRRQHGAVAVMVALSIVALLLMVGLVVDLGRLYVAKTEVQNAADACALSAARELNDRSAGATARAKDAGVTVGTRNLADLQRVAALITRADVSFSDNAEGPWSDEVLANSVYARCAAHYPEPVTVLFVPVSGFLEAASSTQTQYPMDAVAVARPVGSQSFCAVPLAMCTTKPTAVNYGLESGHWYDGRDPAGGGIFGMFGWVAFEGKGGADVGDILAGPGMCGPRPERVDAADGVKQGVVVQAWNTRFGVYGGGRYNDSAAFPPDRTGFPYLSVKDEKTGAYAGNWPPPESQQNPEIDYGTAADPRNAYYDYLQKKAAYVPFRWTDWTGGNLGGARPAPDGDYSSRGQDRRMVMAPIVSCDELEPNGKNIKVLDWACALMLAPIGAPEEVRMEFRGLVSAGACGTSGIPGPFGPPVPALVK